MIPTYSIRSETDLAEAQKAIDRLIAKGKLDAGEELCLDALSDLVAAYAEDRQRTPPPVVLRPRIISSGRSGRPSSSSESPVR